ncbi:MAG TPA: GNAT family N-acetyltransferase [Mycobacteriales bacterium]|jgi:ribosomal protein S18 acetylase RimI-like enzyme|nr:GNAT family N-acetyltransferase [Mycobacteriales bacterium]
MTLPRLRAAGPDDAEVVALLHAHSWRRHYRGAYADSFLDGDIVPDRLSVWASRLAAPANSTTVVAEDDTSVMGFVHVVFDDDDRWGSLVDNLHVVRDRQRTGIGTALLACAAEAVTRQGTGRSMYLWVHEQNTAAQQFYQALGGTCTERTKVSAPGGMPARLNGSPNKLRITWSDAASLTAAAGR